MPAPSASPALSCVGELIAVVGKSQGRLCSRQKVCPEVVSSAGRSGGAGTRALPDGPQHLRRALSDSAMHAETYPGRGYFRSPTHFTLPRLLPECCGAPLWWMLVYFWQPPRLISDCVRRSARPRRRRTRQGRGGSAAMARGLPVESREYHLNNCLCKSCHPALTRCA